LYDLEISSLKVIDKGTNRKHGYGLLFAIYINYGSVLYHFQDKDIGRKS